MKKFITYMDYNYENNKNDKNNNLYIKFGNSTVILNYTKYNLIQDKKILRNLNVNNDLNLIINKEKYIIKKEINNLEDLLDIISNYKLFENANYNININKLIEIKDDLIELNNMIGLHNIKNNILDQLLFYLQNFHERCGINYMHTVIYGPPGTGKTEIAKIIGNIFRKIGILKNNTFKKVVRSDLVAGYLGQTAIKTRNLIEDCLGGVMFIDEAYSLGNSEKKDSFSKECLDTLCECLSNYRKEFMVIIAGYEEELDKCFFSYNPGLKSRFPWIYQTDKSSPEDLFLIFKKMINNINWKIKDNEINVEFFISNKDNFKSYGRDIETFVNKIIICHSKRVFCLEDEEKTIINYKDIDNGLTLFKSNLIKVEENKYQYLMYN